MHLLKKDCGQIKNNSLKMNKDRVKNVLYKDGDYLRDRLSIFNYSTNPENIWDWTWKQYPISSAVSLLEVGTGFGGFWLANAGKLPANCSITLTDISAGMILECQKNLPHINFNPHYVLADVEQLPFENNTFDMVFAHFVLYYTSSPQKALQEIKRVLKPGGIASIFTMHSESNSKLYGILHACDPMFPKKDIALSTFCEENAPTYLDSEFLVQGKYLYEIEIVISSSDCLRSVIHSIAKTYNRPFTTQLFEKFKAAIDLHIASIGQLKTIVRSMLYICEK